MKSCKKVELIFENCNWVSFENPEEAFRSIYLANITETLLISQGASMSTHKRAEFVEIELYRKALNTPTFFDTEIQFGLSLLKKHLYKYKDITHVKILDVDGKELIVEVPWGEIVDPFSEPNPLMKVKEVPWGKETIVCISIGETEEIKEREWNVHR